MKIRKIDNRWLIMAATVLASQTAWPQPLFPTLLGPALILGAAPLVKISLGQYLITALVSSLLSILTGGYYVAAITALQFALWYWSHNKQRAWKWAMAILVPALLMLWLQPERNYIIYGLSLLSPICQALLYYSLTSIAHGRLEQLQREYYYRQGADRLLATTKQARELALLPTVAEELNKAMEQTYAVYQEMEILARTTPQLPQSLIQRLLGAAQQIHNSRLQLLEWYDKQEQSLHDFVGQQAVSLRTICHWIAAYMVGAGGKSGQQVQAVIALRDDTLLAEPLQLPLASLLLQICQHGLAQLTDTEISVNFSGYIAKEGMRIIITFAPTSSQPSGEWPELARCDLTDSNNYAQQLDAICLSGVTSQNEFIYTLELGQR